MQILHYMCTAIIGFARGRIKVTLVTTKTAHFSDLRISHVFFMESGKETFIAEGKSSVTRLVMLGTCLAHYIETQFSMSTKPCN